VTDANVFLRHGDMFDSLTEAECRSLLATRTFGRVGVTSGGLPVILPVRYLYADDAITFRTGGGTKLRAAESGDVLAFEVDAYDTQTSEGWSVLVLGRATVLTTEHEHDDLPTLDAARAEDWRNHYVRLHCELLTGRRLAPALPVIPGTGVST
jgi:nitroimidazol reductase NimA-like FMN-containing flavoprotein (pyridoxamine 5'-phosphate oxidase superfamily)